MYYLYVIYSKSVNRYYVGESPNVENRLRMHQNHYFKNGFTKAATDWEVLLSKECRTKDDAIYLEKFVKRMKSKTFIRKIIEDPKILDDILAKL